MLNRNIIRVTSGQNKSNLLFVPHDELNRWTQTQEMTNSHDETDEATKTGLKKVQIQVMREWSAWEDN